jgi:hypothetical protein
MNVTLRIPQGLWNDLETSIIKKDQQFLKEVARSLGLPIQDVLRKCLTGKPTQVPVLWMNHDDPQQCPWYTSRGSLWFPCQRKRLSPNLPCCIHERPSENTCLNTDPILQSAIRRIPVTRNKCLYWVDPQSGSALHENGMLDSSGIFIITLFKGKRIAIWKPHIAC